MTRTKDAARRGKSHKRPNTNSQKRNSQDDPPSKRAKKNPPSASNATNTSPAQAEPAFLPTSPPELSNQTLPTPEAPPNAIDLSSNLDLTTINITSSTQIQKKVTQILSTLSTYPIPPNEKPKVVMMKAKAGVASKMISIAEIAKRDIGKEGGKWFQHNCVEGVMEEVKEKPRKGKGGKDKWKNDGEGKGREDGGGEGGEVESEEESTAFETMKTPFERANEGKAKVRAVPVMRLYLTRVRIDGLRKAYGEQTNALAAR